MNIRENLKAYVDGELTPSQRDQIQAALDESPELRMEIDDIRAIGRVLGTAVDSLECPGKASALSAIEREATKKRPFLFGGTPAWGFGVVTLAGLLLLFFPPPFAANILGPSGANIMDAEPSVAKGATRAAEGRVVESSPMELATEPALGDVAVASPTVAALAPPANIAPIVIKNGTIALLVKSVDEAQREVEQFASSVRGFVTSSVRSFAAGDATRSIVTVRVPAQTFGATLNKIRSLGRVTEESLSGEDVTVQVVDIEARLTALRAEEEQYRVILRRTTKIGEVLEVRDRISQVRQQIEGMEAQNRFLRDRGSFATIQVTLDQDSVSRPVKPASSLPWYEVAFDRATERLVFLSTAIGTLLIYALVFSPIWGGVLLIAYILRRRY